MADIKIYKKLQNDSGWEYTVRVKDDNGQTEHLVTVPLTTTQKLTGTDTDPDELVIKSFEFLLAREKKESILQKFDINEIGTYFSEWEKEMLK
ncbi:hypothetical protein KKF61_01365 [Patescibacteria group bacterium]|nr:hypothetical protein [Patescibacteria group bacterium]MBU0964265.1 hypothetical protein [Patescibacteria group bacterium]